MRSWFVAIEAGISINAATLAPGVGGESAVKTRRLDINRR
jgi:hypothetical protein